MKKDYKKAIHHVAHIVDLWFPMNMKYREIPGISVGITCGSKLLYKGGFGYANVEKKRKATPDTLYRIASISKVFTTVAIMQLVEKGKPRLDDAVSKYIKWFKGKNTKGTLEHVTIRHILSHSSGLFRDGTTPHWATGEFPKSLKSSMSTKSLVFETLKEFKYSNYAFSLLGEVLHSVSKKPYDDYVRQHILKKLRMGKTYPDLPISEPKEIATGYSRDIPGRKQHPYSHHRTRAYAPATGFISNVTDLAKLLPALTLAKDNVRLLSRESKKEMMRPHGQPEKDAEYGLGLSVYKIAGRRTISHSGGFLGFSTNFVLDVENDIGVIVLANAEGIDAVSMSDGILELIYKFADGESLGQKGKKLPAGRYDGLFRDRFGDDVVITIGSYLVAFPADINYPTKALVLLKPTAQRDMFEMQTENKFSLNGETAKFTDIKSGKAQKVIWGAQPAERVG